MAKRHRAEQTGDSRNVVHVALTPAANLALNRWADLTGAKKTNTLARLLEWFAAAPESMQQVVVGAVPRDMVDAYVKRAAEFFEDYTRQVAGGRAKVKEGELRVGSTKSQRQQKGQAADAGDHVPAKQG